MQVQVNTGENVTGRQDMEQEIEQMLRASLEPWVEQLTRVEVHLSDVNSDKLGDNDKRCLIEARPARHNPVVASHAAGDMRAAIDGALDRLLRALEHALDKINDKHARDTIRRSDVDPGALP